MFNLNILSAEASGFFAVLNEQLRQNFVVADRWKLYLGGLGVTLKVTALSMLTGLVLGTLVATVRSSYEMKLESERSAVLKILNLICKIYTTVIRGTPVLVQLLIFYFVIFTSSRNPAAIAILAFGINSGAYVAEIVRGGIMAVDRGQMEAGRSLGFGYAATMRLIIIPQAVKAILPSIGNEFIALIKETSVVSVIGLRDLTKAAQLIGGKTYQFFVPFILIALVYLLLVMIFTKLLEKLEGRLRSSER